MTHREHRVTNCILSQNGQIINLPLGLFFMTCIYKPLRGPLQVAACEYIRRGMKTGVEITEKSCLSAGKLSKRSTCPPLFLPVPDCASTWTSVNRQNFSLSFGKVPKIFTCPPQFLPVPDRRTGSNFHPWKRAEKQTHSQTK